MATLAAPPGVDVNDPKVKIAKNIINELSDADRWRLAMEFARRGVLTEAVMPQDLQWMTPFVKQVRQGRPFPPPPVEAQRNVAPVLPQTPPQQQDRPASSPSQQPPVSPFPAPVQSPMPGPPTPSWQVPADPQQLLQQNAVSQRILIQQMQQQLSQQMSMEVNAVPNQEQIQQIQRQLNQLMSLSVPPPNSIPGLHAQDTSPPALALHMQKLQEAQVKLQQIGQPSGGFSSVPPEPFLPAAREAFAQQQASVAQSPPASVAHLPTAPMVSKPVAKAKSKPTPKPTLDPVSKNGTTLVLRNFPPEFDAAQAQTWFDDLGLKGQYDFFLFSPHASKRLTQSYAFVNFKVTSDAEQFMRQYHGMSFADQSSSLTDAERRRATLSIAVAKVQGFAENYKRHNQRQLKELETVPFFEQAAVDELLQNASQEFLDSLKEQDDVADASPCSTLSIRNLPPVVDHQTLAMHLLDASGFEDKYDFFVYFPAKQANRKGSSVIQHLAYAFVNFKDPENAQKCRESLNGKVLTEGDVPLSIVAASRVQGFDACCSYFNSFIQGGNIKPWIEGGEVSPAAVVTSLGVFGNFQ